MCSVLEGHRALSLHRLSHMFAVSHSRCVHSSIRNDIQSSTSFDFGCHAGPLLPLRHGCKGPAWHPEFLAIVTGSVSLAELGSEKCQ